MRGSLKVPFIIVRSTVTTWSAKSKGAINFISFSKAELVKEITVCVLILTFIREDIPLIAHEGPKRCV